MEATTVHLLLTCLDRPPERAGGTPVEFGLQDKKGALTAGTDRGDDAVQFDLTVEATPTGGSPPVRFRGPFVQGTPAAPFLYLSLREVGATANTWIKRLKISLAGIDSDLVEAASAPNTRLTATVSGRGSATVPLLDGGWILATDAPE